MAPKARVQKRLYYKIGEACKALGIQPYVLRYWETEFPALSPSKSRSGQRVYSEKELEIIRRIKQLLYDEGYTIAGAKKKLEGELAAGILGESAAAPSAPAAGAAGMPTAQFSFQGTAAAAAAGAGAAAAAGPAAHPASPPSPAGAGGVAGVGASAGASAGPGGAGKGPVRTVPLPLVPQAPAMIRPAAAPEGREGWPTLPLDLPSPQPPEMPAGSVKQGSTSAAEAGAARTATLAKAPVAEAAGPAADRAAGTAEAGPPPAGAAGQALDTDAAKQIETLRKGIHKALQEAREILALLDSRSPQ
jgi:hypothetical protein